MALYGTIEQYGTIWHYMALYGTIWHYRTIWHYMALYGTIEQYEFKHSGKVTLRNDPFEAHAVQVRMRIKAESVHGIDIIAHISHAV